MGANLDSMRLEKLAGRIKDELRVAKVKVHVTKGTVPGRVLVNFEVAKKPVDLKVDKFLYDTKQGWSGEASATTRAAGNSFTLGLASDDDIRCSNATLAFAQNLSGTAWARIAWVFVSNSTISTRCGIRRRCRRILPRSTAAARLLSRRQEWFYLSRSNWTSASVSRDSG